MEGRARGRINFGGETLTGETKPEKATETKLTKIAQRSNDDKQREFKWLIQQVNTESYRQDSGNKRKRRLRERDFQLSDVRKRVMRKMREKKRRSASAQLLFQDIE